MMYLLLFVAHSSSKVIRPMSAPSIEEDVFETHEGKPHCGTMGHYGRCRLLSPSGTKKFSALRKRLLTHPLWSV
eukprot:5381184-Amphidinium_carterae.1